MSKSLNKSCIKVWVGVYGTYKIPPAWEHIKFTRQGWPDKRQSDWEDFMKWVYSIDRWEP